MTRLCATLLVLGWSATALAQDAVWATEDIESTRFFDAEVAGPEIAKGTRLTVVMRDGERVRVRVGTSFGWVAASSVSDEAPASAPPPSLDPEALKRLLQQTGGDIKLDGALKPGGALGAP